jgi:hypothetical protein
MFRVRNEWSTRVATKLTVAVVRCGSCRSTLKAACIV